MSWNDEPLDYDRDQLDGLSEEAFYLYSLQEIAEYAKRDASGVAQDLVRMWPKEARELSQLIIHFSNLPAVEKR